MEGEFNQGSFDNGEFDKEVVAAINLKKLKLRDGVTMQGANGETETVRDLELKESTAGDIMDAAEAAEKLVATEKGFQLVQSDSRAGMEILRRQVVRYGAQQGPMPLSLLRKLSAFDLKFLQTVAEGLDRAAMESVERRGRD